MKYVLASIVVFLSMMVVSVLVFSPLIVGSIGPAMSEFLDGVPFCSEEGVSVMLSADSPDMAGIVLTAVSLTIGVVTVLIAALTFMGGSAIRQLIAIRDDYKRDLAEFEDFKARVVLERREFENLVEAVVTSYVDAWITRIGLEKKLYVAAGRGSEAIDPEAASPLYAYSDGLQVRRSMFGIDSYGNLVARGELRDRPKSSVRRASDQKTGGFRAKGVSPPGHWSKQALLDTEAMVKRSFNFLTGNLQKLTAPIPGDEEDELRKKVGPLVQNMSSAIDFLDSSGRLLETRECRRAYRWLRDALDELGSPASG